MDANQLKYYCGGYPFAFSERARQIVGEVPVRYAVIAWNPVRSWGLDGRVMVLPHGLREGEYCGRWMDQFRLSHSTINLLTENFTTKRACHRLIVESWHLMRFDGLSFDEVHKALLVVPELLSIIGEDADWPYKG